jgi:hypothetical protein
MNIRKVKGVNLSEARDKASLLFNNKFVILESAESRPGIPASITVAIDESEIDRYRSDAKTKKPVHLLKPLLGQFEELFDKGNRSINKFMENNSESHKGTDNSPVSDRDNPDSRVKSTLKEKTPGVYFEKSSNSYNTYPPQKKRKAEKSPDKENKIYRDSLPEEAKRNHYLDVNDTPSVNFHFEHIQQRLQQLERITRRIGNELMPDISGNPVYRHLLSKKFHPDLLNHWFSNTMLPSGQPEIQLNQIKKILTNELQPKNPDSANGVYLFSGLSGSGIDNVINFLISHNRNFLADTFRPVLISDQPSLLKSVNLSDEIPGYTISTNAEWRQILNSEGKGSTFFIKTKALPLELDGVAQKWNEYSLLFDGPLEPEHHFVTHSLFDPEQVIHQLPANHYFKPDYISFSNVDYCVDSPGNFYIYKYYLKTKTGFLHTDSYNNTTSEKIVEWSLKNLKSDDF